MECPNCGRHLSHHSQRCITCGKSIPPAQHLLEQSGVVSPSTPPPTATIIDVSGPTCRTAHLGDRLIAAALDHVVILGICAVVSVWSFTHWGVASPSEFQLTAASLLIAAMLSGACAFVYLWLFEAAFEATLGKVIVGLRVVRTTSRGPLAACAMRNALRLIDGLGFYLVGALFAGCTRLRQRLGDLVAGTAVVEERLPAGVKALALVVWTAVVVGSIWAVPRVASKPLPADPPRYFGSPVVQIGSAPGSAHIRWAQWRVELQFPPDAPQASQIRSASTIETSH